MPEEVCGLRRGPGRRQKLGRARQGQAPGPALSGDPSAAGAPDLSGAGGQPHPLSAAGAGRSRGIPGHRPAVRFPQWQRPGLRLLRRRRRHGPLSGGGIRRDLPGRGHPAEGGVAAAVCRLPAGRQRISQAAVLHLQPRRAGAQLYQAPVHRPAVPGGGKPR